MTRAGIVTVVGKPNAGKSTLLNRLVGEKLSITSEKPQSTRDRIAGIRTEDDTQMIVFDTPGLLEPRYALQESMRSASLAALDDADVIIYLADARQGIPEPLVEAARLSSAPSAPVLTVLNKVDVIAAAARDALRAALPESFQISALTGHGVAELIDAVIPRLPESPFLYPADEIGTQSVRFFVSELIRETVLEQLEEEVPYSVACGIEEFREERSPVYIRAVIYVERKSQKGIVVGKNGARIREIGTVARGKIEQLIGSPVFLDLWVKVLHNWRRNANALRQFGYTLPKGYDA